MHGCVHVSTCMKSVLARSKLSLYHLSVGSQSQSDRIYMAGMWWYLFIQLASASISTSHFKYHPHVLPRPYKTHKHTHLLLIWTEEDITHGACGSPFYEVLTQWIVTIWMIIIKRYIMNSNAKHVTCQSARPGRWERQNYRSVHTSHSHSFSGFSYALVLWAISHQIYSDAGGIKSFGYAIIGFRN